VLASSAAQHLRKKLSFNYNYEQPPVAHYHADMSDEYKERTLTDFINGKIAVLCATEAAGMVNIIY
jgi:superfamily II DNA helicase RecQ